MIFSINLKNHTVYSSKKPSQRPSSTLRTRGSQWSQYTLTLWRQPYHVQASWAKIVLLPYLCQKSVTCIFNILLVMYTTTHTISLNFCLFNDLSTLLRESIVVANVNESMPFLLRLDVNKTQRFVLRASSGVQTNEHIITIKLRKNSCRS